MKKACTSEMPVSTYTDTWFQNTQECNLNTYYRGADKSLARPGRKQSTATEDVDVHISYL